MFSSCDISTFTKGSVLKISIQHSCLSANSLYFDDKYWCNNVIEVLSQEGSQQSEDAHARCSKMHEATILSACLSVKVTTCRLYWAGLEDHRTQQCTSVLLYVPTDDLFLRLKCDLTNHWHHSLNSRVNVPTSYETRTNSCLNYFQ